MKNNSTFLSKKAGSFSGVPQRTVQAWTEKGLIDSVTTGSGDRRRYTVRNCVEIAIVKALAKDRLPFKIIYKTMNYIRTKFKSSKQMCWIVLMFKVSGQIDIVLLVGNSNDSLKFVGYEKLIFINLPIIVNTILQEIYK